MKTLIIAFGLTVLLIAPVTHAQDSGAESTKFQLAPTCEGKTCSACNLVEFGNNAIQWLITISFLFFAILAVKAGINLVISQGNPGALTEAKSSFTNAFIGLIIILVAFILVDTIMRQLLKGSGEIEGYGPWSEVRCAKQVEPGLVAGYFDGDQAFEQRATATGDNQKTLAPGDVSGRVAGIKSTPQVTAAANAALDEMGITDPKLRNTYRALLSQESGNCTNKVGPDTGKGRGRAYGCSQFLVSTARDFDKQLDKRFAGKSDAEVASILQNDNTYSIRLGALYFKEGLKRYGNDVDKTLASYNGGPGSNKPSTTCPGQTQWQCTSNQGYAQTRNYVANIKAVAGAM